MTANRLRSTARSLLPPAATKAILRIKNGAPKPVWQGVYDHRREVPESGPGFQADEWTLQLRQQLERMREARKTLGYVPTDLFDTTVLAAMCSTVGRAARVLDFGGGLGAAYEGLRAALGPQIKLRYVVKELDEVVAEGKRAHAGDPHIEFSADMPDPTERFDVVHVRTALQYIDDYKAQLGQFAAYRPRYILLMTTSAVAGRTFATAQLNHAGSSIGYWFLGQQDLIDTMDALGYGLRLAALHPRQDRVVDLPYDLDALRPRDFVFERVKQP